MIQHIQSKPVTRRRFTVTFDGNGHPSHKSKSALLDQVETWDKQAVADLSIEDINDMDCETLAQVVRAVEFPAIFRTDLEQRLDFLDEDTLRRLAFLARQCCRNQGY